MLVLPAPDRPVNLVARKQTKKRSQPRAKHKVSTRPDQMVQPRNLTSTPSECARLERETLINEGKKVKHDSSWKPAFISAPSIPALSPCFPRHHLLSSFALSLLEAALPFFPTFFLSFLLLLLTLCSSAVMLVAMMGLRKEQQDG